jgi:hypothetical protein
MAPGMKLVLVTVLATALVAVSAAGAASTPASYRSHVNAICRGYTAKFKPIEADINRAQAAGDGRAFANALARLVVGDLAQHRDIERTPVPAAMSAQMAPIVRVFKRIDLHIRLAIAAARTGDSKGWNAELSAALKAAEPINRMLDAAGLRDCGSNQ